MVISTAKITLEASNGLNRINSVTKAKCFFTSLVSLLTFYGTGSLPPS